jgi:8-oxo-dGTP pyrophosphatase MutT (NUDIX family)
MMNLPFVWKPEVKNGRTYLPIETSRMYCNNCGNKGHVFKSCPEPIISYGIILIDQPSIPLKTLPKILMVRRKDSMAFTEFLRGKYEVDHIDYIILLLSNMTKNEHAVLQRLTFEQLWTLHWGVGRDHHSKEFELSREKFNQLHISDLIKGLEGYSESEWGFPKGRRSPRESDMDCAIREFSEETNISRESYVICKNLLLSETFNGTNGIPYRHDYFVALLRDPGSIDLEQTMTTMQKKEVSAIEWKSIEECKSITRPHYTQRSELLESFKRIIQTFDLQDNIAFNQ